MERQVFSRIFESAFDVMGSDALLVFESIVSKYEVI